MPKRIIFHLSHLAHHGAGHKGSRDWQIKREGTAKPVKTFSRKDKALPFAKRLAKKHQPSQLKIHGHDGKIQTEYTYLNDPERFPG